MDIKQEDEDDNASESTLKFGSTSSHSAETGLSSDTKNNKFTTSNFVETVVTQSESVFGSDAKPAAADPSRGKKRKTSSAGVKTGSFYLRLCRATFSII